MVAEDRGRLGTLLECSSESTMDFFRRWSSSLARRSASMDLFAK